MPNDLRTELGENEQVEPLEKAIGDYLDQLNSGTVLDPKQILAEHPELGPEILENLEDFVELRPPEGYAPVLGTVGDYTLRRQIGRGGMGVVYEAWENSMDRAVALKVLPAGIAADDKAVTRFVREARLAGKLNHPHVVGVYGMGVEEQTPYYAMELVEGETLAQLLARLKDVEPEGETPFGKKDSVVYFSKLAETFADVADGLQHAHSKGVVHRDIKPSNLILDGEDRLRILDFGLAHLEGQESVTLSGDVVGTLLYMSPEQARAKKIAIDHRTDIYSLGATMYETLTQQPPFRGKDHAATLSQISERDPTEPRKLNSRVPMDLETVAMKCLRKAPGDRYGTAEALAQDLRRYARGEPVEARPLSAWEKAGRQVSRHRVGALASVGILLFTLASLAVSNALISHERDLFEEQRDDARRNLYLAHMRLAHEDWQAGNMGRLADLLELHRPQPDESDQRGWEWYYLRSRINRGHEILEGHADRVCTVAWSPDGERFASGDEAGRVKVWNASNLEELHTLSQEIDWSSPVSGEWVLQVAWSPDSRYLASGATDKRVTIWDAYTGERVRTLEDWSQLSSVAWSPDNRWLAAGGGWSGTITVWNVSSWQEEKRLEFNNTVSAISWSPNSRWLAACTSGPAVLTIWDSQTWSANPTRFGKFSNIPEIAWSPDGDWLALPTSEIVHIWDPSAGREVMTLGGHDAPMRCVSWSAEGLLASGGSDGIVKIWDVETGDCLHWFRGHAGAVRSVVWSPDGHRLLSGGNDGTLRLWEPETIEHNALAFADSSWIVWSPDGGRVVSNLLSSRTPDEESGKGNLVQLAVLDATTGERVVNLDGWVGGVRCATWSPDAKRIAVAARKGGLVKVWRAATGEELLSWTAHSGEARSVSWSPDSRLVATGGYDRVVKIWDVETGEPILALHGHNGTVGSVVWSPDGRRIASSSWDQVVKVWDAATGDEVLSLRRHRFYSSAADSQYSIAWSPDSERLASGSSEGVLILWDASTGLELVRTRGHNANVRSVSWSPNGLRLASAGEDRTVRVWDAASGQELLTFGDLGAVAAKVAWSPDGWRLACHRWVNPRTVKSWPVNVSRRVVVWDASPSVEEDLPDE